MRQRERGRVTGLTGTGRRIPRIGGDHINRKRRRKKRKASRRMGMKN